MSAEPQEHKLSHLMDALLRVRDGFLSCEAQLDGVHKSLSKPYLTSAPRWQIIVDDQPPGVRITAHVLEVAHCSFFPLPAFCACVTRADSQSISCNLKMIAR
ncbi:hypothetical protein C0Q70_01743 [Pomacea canaliculata]|uniref:Uncharacterized protein n=1 Tax=Pomacea canaliculata TaxID=400727 RepID=A0A2T7Q0B7_POMCA|nr:hypothetical protein C0Q70_01743 [Pomacea canaliculata]